MSKYVDIEPLENALKAVEKRGEVAVLLDELLSVIAKYPTADVAEVKHGRWRKERVSSTGRGSYGVYQCSICGAMFPDIGYGYNYCPNCGASMRGEEDANE